jgi:hypothetical protein
MALWLVIYIINNKIVVSCCESQIDFLYHHLYTTLTLSKLQISTTLIKLISSFLSNRKFKVPVKGKMSTPREIQAGVLQGYILAPTLYSLYINDAPKNVFIWSFLLMTYSIYCTDCKEGYVLRTLHCSLTLMESWCERWNIKINEYKTQASYFSLRCRPVRAHLILNSQNIPL